MRTAKKSPAKPVAAKPAEKSAKLAPAKDGGKAKTPAKMPPSTGVSEQLETRLIKLGRVKGILTYDDLNKHLPADEFSPEVIDELITRLAAKGVKVIELPEVDDKVDVPFAEADDDEAAPTTPWRAVIEVEPEKEEESYGRSGRPRSHVFARNGQCRIAQPRRRNRNCQTHRIRPRNGHLVACESPTVMHLVLGWRDKLANGEILLREVIDLDATYGAGTEDKFAEAQRMQGDAVEVEEEEADEYDALEGWPQRAGRSR